MTIQNLIHVSLLGYVEYPPFLDVIVLMHISLENPILFKVMNIGRQCVCMRIHHTTGNHPSSVARRVIRWRSDSIVPRKRPDSVTLEASPIAAAIFFNF
jgi:hypothetical protein